MGPRMLWLLAAVACWLQLALATSNMPFPVLFAPETSRRQVHLVADLWDGADYYQLDELLDLESMRASLRLTDALGRSQTHLFDLWRCLSWSYEPYSCRMHESRTQLFGQEAAWMVELTPKQRNASAEASPEAGSSNGLPLKCYLQGLTALWMNAAHMNKRTGGVLFPYSSARKEYSWPMREWTFKDSQTQANIRMMFSEMSSATSGGSEAEPEANPNTTPSSSSSTTSMMLEHIQIENQDWSLIKSINVVSVEYELESEFVDQRLRLPLGYGCLTAEQLDLSFKDQFRSLREMSQLDKSAASGELSKTWLSESHFFSMQVTATKYLDSRSRVLPRPQSASKRVELALALGGAAPVFKSRTRDASGDHLQILDHKYNVRFAIDAHRGTCVISNMGQKSWSGGPQNGDHDEAAAARVPVNFENGLSVDLDLHRVGLLFTEPLDFRLVQETPDTLYFEADVDQLVVGSKVRVVRAYRRPQLDTEPVGGPGGELLSVSVLVLEPDQKRAVESYNWRLLEAGKLPSLGQQARQMDVSQQCYLDKPEMLEGRDYLWVRLTYSAPNRDLRAWASRPGQLEDLVRERLLAAPGAPDLLRAPRVELEFWPGQLEARVLLLEGPGIGLTFERTPGMGLAREQRDQSLLAADMEHCEQLCRAHKCASFSYCTDTYGCWLAKERAPSAQLEYKTYCTTLSAPEEGAPSQFSVRGWLTRARANQQLPIELPEMEELLALPEHETGIGGGQLARARRAYLGQVDRALANSGNSLAPLTIVAEADGALSALVPSQLELEEPRDFGSGRARLQAEAAWGGGPAPEVYEGAPAAYVVGLTMNKFDRNALASSPQLARTSVRWRSYEGLTYDQCALACADFGCESFSHCGSQRECIVTDIRKLAMAFLDLVLESNNQPQQQQQPQHRQVSYLRTDTDCVVARRDFLSRFERFKGVYRSPTYSATHDAANAAECAQYCVGADGCTAFDFCAPNSCLLLTDRRLTAGLLPATVSTSCDHYSRSYLADYDAAHDQQLATSGPSGPRTSGAPEPLLGGQLSGVGLEACAELCAHSSTCSVFEFCAKPDGEHACTLVGALGAPAAPVAPPAAGALKLEPSSECSVYALRADSVEAQSRDRALDLSPSGAARWPGWPSDPEAQFSWPGWLAWAALVAALVGPASALVTWRVLRRRA